MNHSVATYAHASIALLGLTSSFTRAADADFAYLLQRQYGGVAPPEPELERRRREVRQNTATYRRTLQRKTALSLVWVAIAAAVAYWLVVSPTLAAGARPTLQQIYGATSVLLFSWGTLGRLGWNQGSIGGATVFEELDTIIFWLLYGLGTFFGVGAVASAA